jgi:hypothetical protein
MHEAWFTFFYQYLIGGAIAGSTLVFAVKTGAIDFKQNVERRLVYALFAGLFAFSVIHGVWTHVVLS